jgi:hypothetical protein
LDFNLKLQSEKAIGKLLVGAVPETETKISSEKPLLFPEKVPSNRVLINEKLGYKGCRIKTRAKWFQ